MSRIDVPCRELTVSTHAHQDAGVLVQVRDIGEGFDPGFDQMFNAFQTTKKRGLGWGFRSVARSWKITMDQLWATGNEGPGAGFHFTHFNDPYPSEDRSGYLLFQGSDTDNTNV